MARSKLSFTPSIAEPCEESWAAMQGGPRERHCELCDQQVYNFAAMTPREIEKMAREQNGKFCARITHGEDGSLVTLDALTRRPIAAQLVATASLALSATALAAKSSPTLQTQSAEDTEQIASPASPGDHALVGQVTVISKDGQSEPELQLEHPPSASLVEETSQKENAQALLTGTVMKNDGSGPMEGVLISLRANGSVIAEGLSNNCGKFHISAPAGVYDFEAAAGAERIRFKAISLISGEQSVGTISTAVSTVEVTAFAPGDSYTTMGTMTATIGHRLGFWYMLRHPIQYARFRKLQG